MITQKTPQEEIDQSEYGKGFEYVNCSTKSHFEIFERINDDGKREVLYCFYDGDRKGEITDKPWEE